MNLKRQKNLVDGLWIEANNGEVIDVTNPATSESIGTVPNCGSVETSTAIDAAATAHVGWRNKTAEQRADLIMQLHDAILDNTSGLAELLTEEMGKPLAEARGEIVFGAKFFKWFAEEGRRIYGDVIPSPWPGKRIVVTKEPVGAVGAITPWNFPNSMIARKLSAALAAGCTMVIKPASQTPFSALAIGALAEEAGFPAGVVNIITGSAPKIAAEMCGNPKLRKITFTGSTSVGKRLLSEAGANMKRVSLELGGNAPFIVFDDANIDAAVQGAMASKFRNTGQTCVCANRFLVQSGVYDEFAGKFASAISGLTVGDGRKPNISQGPLIDASAVEKVQEHTADAVKKGGKVLLGGHRHDLGGLFYQPTLITGAITDMLVAKEETFGPLAAIFRFETEEQAVAMANDTEYGLACYFYTRDLGRAWRVMDALEYGMVGINEGHISTEVAPFGGIKDSGIGLEGSHYGVNEYVNVKYTLMGGLAAA